MVTHIYVCTFMYSISISTIGDEYNGELKRYVRKVREGE
jgi:uncharacterized membrane protein